MLDDAYHEEDDIEPIEPIEPSPTKRVLLVHAMSGMTLQGLLDISKQEALLCTLRDAN